MILIEGLLAIFFFKDNAHNAQNAIHCFGNELNCGTCRRRISMNSMNFEHINIAYLNELISNLF